MFFKSKLERRLRIQRQYDVSVQCKSKSQIACIRKACAITSQIYERVIDHDLRPGRTEKELAETIYTYSQLYGADKDLAFETIVGSGPNSSLVHSQPTDRKIKKGDIVQFDFGVRVNGFCSDMSRVIFVGKKGQFSKKKHNIFAIVKRQQAKAMKRLSRHDEFKSIGEKTLNAFKKRGLHYNYLHSLGHGVGIEIHEFPAISPKIKTGLKPAPGMVVTIEPGLYFPAKFGCRIEDTILITESGIDILTTATKRQYWK